MRTLHLDPTTNAQLFAYMKTYGIPRATLAKLLNVSIHSIDKWRLPPSAKGHRRVPSTTLMYLKLLVFTAQTAPLHLLKVTGAVNCDALAACKIERITRERN